MPPSLLVTSPTSGSFGEASPFHMGVADQGGPAPRRGRREDEVQFPSRRDLAGMKRNSRGGQHQQQQQQQTMRCAQDAQVNPLKNHAITRQEPPWRDVTTVMMRNLPNKYCQQMLLEELRHHGFQLQVDFDFFYLPMDHTNAVNLGYCFINFVSSSAANNFAAAFSGKRMRLFNSSKMVSVMPASIQGYERNYAYYSATKVAQAEDPQYRPIFVRTLPAEASLSPHAHDYSMAPVLPTFVWHVQLVPVVQEEYSVSSLAEPFVASLPVRTHDPGYDTDEEREVLLAQGLLRGPHDTYVQGVPPAEAWPTPTSPLAVHSPSFVVRNTFLDAWPSAERGDGWCRAQSSPPSAGTDGAAGSAGIVEDVSPRSGGQEPRPAHGDPPALWDLASVVAAVNRREESSSTSWSSEERGEHPGAPADGSTRSGSSASKPADSPVRGPADLPCDVVPPEPAEVQSSLQETGGPILCALVDPIRGSALHRAGACKPCVFYGNTATGCRSGADCAFCHLCEPGEKKRRNKERRALRRQARGPQLV